MLRCFRLALALVFVLLGHIAYAIDKPQPTVNPLKVGTRLTFGPEIRNVRDAAAYLLEPTGYRITGSTVDPRALAAILSRPLTPLAQNAGIGSIEDGLLLIIGEENRLVVDHRNKLVTFEPIPPER